MRPAFPLTPSVRVLCVCIALGASVGCQRSQPGPTRLPTVPVRGKVTVDELPALGLMVRFHSQGEPKGMSEIYASKPTAVTDGDGHFELSTYEDGDGVAAGVYAVTFEWKKFDPLKNGYGGPDQLGGKYADPETSEFTVTVTGNEEQPIQLETFELTR